MYRSELLAFWDEAENNGFALNNYNGFSNDSDLILFRIFGDTPVLFSAPHATKHVRGGFVQEEDRATGGLAVVLARYIKASYIAMGGNQTGDPNHDQNHLYKNTIKEWAESGGRILIDLHGIGHKTVADTGAHIGVGLGPNPSPASGFLSRAIKVRGKKLGVEVRVGNSAFAALHESTITATATRYGLYAVQLELAPHLRFGKGNEQHRETVIRLIAGVVSDAVDILPQLDKLVEFAELI